MVVKLLHYLTVVQNQDFKETVAGAEQGYNPLLVFKSEASAFATAAAKLRTRCEEVLAETF